MKIGRVQFLKPVNIPHYNTVEGLTWKDHNHELDMDFDGSILTIRGMPERLNGRMVEVSVPSTNIASFLTMDAELEWSKENDRRKAEEEARRQRQKERNEEREASRLKSESAPEGGVAISGGKKASKGSGGKKAGAGGGASKG